MEKDPLPQVSSNVHGSQDSSIMPPGEENGNVDKSQDTTYGWICVAGAFLINMHTWGILTVCFLYSHLPGL
jgi:hypothetical protein